MPNVGFGYYLLPFRFLDSPSRSRNESLASFMRRIGICGERGSGIDKVVSQTELYQLPAPVFEVIGDHTRVTLYSYKPFNEMEREEKIHACLKYVTKDYMTNTSIRQRLAEPVAMSLPYVPDKSAYHHY